MIRYGTYPIREIFGLMEQRRYAEEYFTPAPAPRLSSSRLILFKEKGIRCVTCDLEATHFVLEAVGKERPHLNLYALCEQGREILFTKDHIHPKARGGRDEMGNYQPMCEPCNGRKADKVAQK